MKFLGNVEIGVCLKERAELQMSLRVPAYM